MGALGQTSVIAGTATTTETPVQVPNTFLRGYPQQANGSTRPTARPQSGPIIKGSIRIQNLDATNNLLVRINKTAQITILKGAAPFKLEHVVIWDLTVQSSASTVAYEIAADV